MSVTPARQLPRIPVSDRLAGAPISWGVCEVPGWGVELPPDRVLAEMSALGLRATEFGPIGYLGADARAVVALLERHGLKLVGGFVPAVLHDPAELGETLSSVARTAALYAACGATFLVSAAVVDAAWSPRRPLRDTEWRHLLGALARLDELAAGHRLRHVLHPHVGTLVETADDVRRVLDGSDVRFCLDTGHLAIGGTDPVAFAEEAAARVAHVHLKDVRQEVAARLRAEEVSLVRAVQLGLFRPLGEGDAPVADTVLALERQGYEGWYVLEQDTALDSAAIPEGRGPVEDVQRSVAFLHRCLTPSEAGWERQRG